MDLHVTERALEDLGLSQDLSSLSLEEFIDQHAVLKAFYERRSQSPIGQEAIQLPRSKQVVYSLHSGRYRGLTWFDDDDDVCWLLGVGFHESGSRDDVYSVLKGRDFNDDLLPTETDYLALYKWRRESGVSALDDLVAIIAQVGPELLSEARSTPGERIGRVIEEGLEVEFLLEQIRDGSTVLRQYTVTFIMPPRKPGLLPSGTSWQTMLVFAFLPQGARIENLEWRTDSRGESVIYIEVEDAPI